MIENLLDPVVLCFAAGLLAGVLRSDLKLPPALYDTLSIYLLLAIGLKGGVELSQSPLAALVGPVLGTLALGILIPVASYALLHRLGRFKRVDAAAIAAHYGSVSAVTFAVVLAYLARLAEPYESYVTVLLVVLEVPAIGVGIVLARLADQKRGKMAVGQLAHELFLGRSIYLLLAGLAVGYLAGPERTEGIAPVFFGLFQGALALFLLEMGLVASRRLGELRSSGVFLVAFGIAMPLMAGLVGAGTATLVGMSIGGATVLATLAGSASYIAAPAAMRIAVPEANPTLYLTASLGITYPFNILVGIPIYHEMASWIGS